MAPCDPGHIIPTIDSLQIPTAAIFAAVFVVRPVRSASAASPLRAASPVRQDPKRRLFLQILSWHAFFACNPLIVIR
jgi:hypothetical protein